MAEKKVVIIVPAFNEGKWIGNTLDLIFRTGLVRDRADVVVVNDGSTDKTSEIAREKGCTVIDFPVNRGKANAFFAGMKEARRRDAAAAVTLDADMLKIPKESLGELIRSAQMSSREKTQRMFVAPVIEGEKPLAIFPTWSGIRSFSRDAIRAIVSVKKVKKFVRGFALEQFLNSFLVPECIKPSHTKDPFWARQSYAAEEPDGRQAREIGNFNRCRRKGPLKRLETERKKLWNRPK